MSTTPETQLVERAAKIIRGKLESMSEDTENLRLIYSTLVELIGKLSKTSCGFILTFALNDQIIKTEIPEPGTSLSESEVGVNVNEITEIILENKLSITRLGIEEVTEMLSLKEGPSTTKQTPLFKNDLELRAQQASDDYR